EVSAIPLFSRTIIDMNINNLVVVAPDAGATKRARMLAKRLDCPIAIVDKRRTVHNDAEVMNIIGDVTDKNAIILDDIIDTGNSIVKAVKAIKRESKSVYVCATHPVFSGDCHDKLLNSEAEKIIVANTLPITFEEDKFVVVNMGRFLSEVIRNIHQNRSVNELFN
ncbi:MAG: ribose-phosphate diphosphokinase, partial [Candidatus Woesearchaeota archaeon]